MDRLPNTPGAAPLALRPREAAIAIGISERTLRKLVASGKIRPARIGRCIAFTMEELKRFLEASTDPQKKGDA